MKKYMIWFLLVSVGINIGLTAYLTQTLHEKNELISELSSKLLPLKAKPLRNTSDKTVNIAFEDTSQDKDLLIYEVETLKETSKYYRSFIDQVLLNMSKEEQVEIAKNEWQYALEISYYNDGGQVILPIEDQMVMNQSHFTIRLSELRHLNPIISDTFLLNALKLNESDFKLDISGDDYTVYLGNRDDGMGYLETYKTYDFEYPSRDVMIELSHALQDKLGYETSVITLKVGSY